MKRIIIATVLLCLGVCAVWAQEGKPSGPNPPCTAFGTISGQCIQGGAAGAQFVQGAAAGFVNKFRNGTFDIWQRGTSALATGSSAPGSYTADGWQVVQSGAQGTCAQDTGTAGTLFSLRCVGITSNTDTQFSQPIEAAVAVPLAGNVVTTQVWFKQDTGSSVTPKFSTCFASATNNFATCTGDIASTSLTACASGTWCLESYTYTASASASQGYRPTLDCNTALTSAQHCWITAADTRVTIGATCSGTAPPCVQASPPAPELRPIAIELAFCQRYFFGITGTASQAYASGEVDTSTSFISPVFFPVTMQRAPSLSNSGNATFTVRAGGTSFTPSGIALTESAAQSSYITWTISGGTAGFAGFVRDAGSANSNLQFSAEL